MDLSPATLIVNQQSVLLACLVVIASVQNAPSNRIRCVDSYPWLGEAKTRFWLNGHNDRLKRITKFERWQFEELAAMPVVSEGRTISKEQKLLIFLQAIADNRHFRGLAETFHHSLSTISAVFKEVLQATMHIYRQCVIPSAARDDIPLRRRGARYWPHFRGCVGALDGIHLPAYVPTGRQAAYRNRKGLLTHNVLAVVDHELKFRYVLAGWEGSAHDSRVLDSAVRQYGLEAPGEGCYWLADAGYNNSDITMVPYRGVRYHLKEWPNHHRRPQSAKKVFNIRHSSVRNVVARAFGILKKRFRMLETPQAFQIKVQVRIVYACVALHNLLVDGGDLGDSESADLEHDRYQVDNQGVGDGDDNGSSHIMAKRRDNIAEEMQGRHSHREDGEEATNELAAEG